MTRLFLKPKRDRSVRKHHPWVFSGALATLPAENEAQSVRLGETVEVMSAEGESLGFGSYSPASQIRVRLLSFDPAVIPDEAYIAHLVTESVCRRKSFFGAESTTNGCRVINAESDGLPGVVADWYAGWVVCQLTSAGAEFWKKTIAAALLAAVPGCRGVCERADAEMRRKEGLTVERTLVTLAGEDPPEYIEISEGAARYAVDVRNGHKTGFYLDQREARTTVGSLARGLSVLNCFCYTGGFGLAAAVGGATRVTQVDVSRDALALARRNAETTGVGGITEEIEADVFQYLRQCRDARRSFDMIVLDPPKFAESKSQVMKAARGYKDINLLAMKLLRPKGVLATFSCSGAMTTEMFDRILAEASQDAGRDFQMIARTRQAADHPVALNFPEGLYLKGVFLRSMT